MSTSDRDKWNQRYADGAYADRSHASVLLREWVEHVPAGRALDIACGAGRNALYLAEHGFTVDALDISGEALARAGAAARARNLSLNLVEQDLDLPVTFPGDYQLILMVRFVNLPLLRRLAGCLAPGGFLICEEHLLSDEAVIGPANPDYRVVPGQLADCVEGLALCYQHEGVVTEPDGRRAALSQVVARRARQGP